MRRCNQPPAVVPAAIAAAASAIVSYFHFNQPTLNRISDDKGIHHKSRGGSVISPTPFYLHQSALKLWRANHSPWFVAPTKCDAMRNNTPNNNSTTALPDDDTANNIPAATDDTTDGIRFLLPENGTKRVRKDVSS